jgi:histidinol-phosphatase (PHP family)
MIDYHIHTYRCCHATGSPDEYVVEAENLGLEEIGFADHFPLGMLDYTPRVQVTMLPEELEEYLEQVEKLKQSSGKIIIKTGIEIDYLPGTEEKLEKLLDQYSFDYVIGSIHFMEGWDFTHPVYAETYQDRDLNALYDQYFNLVWSACRTGLFDLIGHIDVIKKFGFRPDSPLDDYWQKTVAVLAETGTCFELNTAGRDAPVGEFYPDRRLLELAVAEGVPVVTGSDAHSPEQVGRYFDEARNLLLETGYRETVSFNKRRKSFRAL